MRALTYQPLRWQGTRTAKALSGVRRKSGKGAPERSQSPSRARWLELEGQTEASVDRRLVDGEQAVELVGKQLPILLERRAFQDCVQAEVGRILGARGINHQGSELDRARRGHTNFVVLKSAIDRQVNQAVGRGPGQRHEFTRPELDTIEQRFVDLVAAAEREVFGAEA